MQVTPKTDEQIEKEESERLLWDIGEYGFEIIEFVKFGETILHTKDTLSKKDNEMIQLAVKVFNKEGQSSTIMDYLLDAMPKKIKNAAYTCGLGDKYESGTLLAEDFIGKTGNLKLGISKGKPKDDGSGDNYPDRNSVENYIVDSAPPQSAPVDDMEDSIPF